MKRRQRNLKEILDGSDLTDPQELAGALRVSTPTVYSWIRTKSIPFVKLGVCVRFDPAELAAWLDERRVAK